MSTLSLISRLFKKESAAVKTALTRFIVFMVIISISVVIALVGISYLIWSSYLYLSTLFEPYIAALITGGGLILIGAAVASIGWLVTLGASESAEQPQEPAKSEFDEASDIIKEYPFESGVTAAALGFLVGSSPDVRKNLADILYQLRQNSRMN